MKAISKKIVLIVLIVAFTLTTTVSAYAYFTSELSKNINGQVTGKATEKAVSSFDDLWAYSVGASTTTIDESQVVTGINNDNSSVSDSANRYILVFQNDITLDADIEFNSDVHLNLNGNKLYLDGNELAFSHTYHGNTILSNGTVIVDEKIADDSAEGSVAKIGKIYYDTPYSKNILESVSFENLKGDSLTAEDYCVDVSNNNFVTAYNALRLVAKKVVNYPDTLPEMQNYESVSALTETSFNSNLFLATKFCLSGDSTTAEACAFVFGDLDLPLYVKGYDDVTISYSSSNADVLSNSGNVTPQSSIQTVTLTVTVSKIADGASETIGTSDFCLHIVNPQDQTQLMSASKSLLNSYMYKYYQLVTAEDGTTSYSYVISRSIQLPSSFVANGTTISLTYNTYSDSTMKSEVTDTMTVKENVTVFEPTSAVVVLKATIGIGTSTDTHAYSVTASDTGLIRTDASYAQDFAIANYGGQITVEANEQENGTFSFKNYELQTPVSSSATDDVNNKIISVKYSLVNDTNGLYELIGCDQAFTHDSAADARGYVKVVDGKNPFDYVQTVQLNCEFVIDGLGEDEAVSIQIPIRCETTAGTNISEFPVYYNYYDQMFFSLTAGYTVKSFEMPFASGSTDNDFAVCYDILSYDADGNEIWNQASGLTLSLYYNGNTIALTPTTNDDGYVSYVPALNSYLSANNLTVKSIATYGDSKWIFTIDTSNLISQNQDIEFVYNYRHIATNAMFTPYMDNEKTKYLTTSFTIPGILRYSATEQNTVDGVVTDQNLYTVIGTLFGGESFSEDSSVILTDWLKSSIAVSVEDTTTCGSSTVGEMLKSVNDFSALKYLVGTTLLNLTGITLSGTNYETNIKAIASMSALETLILENCGLGVNVSTSSPVDSVLENLSSLKNLKSINLGNNNIYSFSFLTDLTSLNVVRVYDNLDTSTIDGLFYGSEGLVNMEYFAELTEAGVAVYNTRSDSAEILYTKQSGINDYKSLQSIAYQKKLKGNTSIVTCFMPFVTSTSTASDGTTTYSTDPDIFGLNTSYSYGGNTAYVSNANIVWNYEGDDPTTSTRFYLDYNFTLSGTNVTLRVNFTVVRVDTAEVSA